MLTFRMKASTAILIAMLSGCSDEQLDTARKDSSSEQAVLSDRADEWLELAEGMSAAEWLAARSAAQGKALSDPAKAELDAALATAALRLGESPRMIANRSVQLEAMLRGIGQQQDAISLIRQLTSAIGETGQTEGFGAISQHYYIMRKGGMSAEEALDDLKRRYGPRG